MPNDLRTQKLAKLLVRYSVFVKPHENVIISGATEAEPLLLAIYKEVILAGAHPILRVNVPGTNPFFYKFAKKHQIEKFPDYFDYLVKNSQKYIGIDASDSPRELSNSNPKKISARGKITHPITEYIVSSKPKMDRCTVGFPCQGLAQEAEMSLSEYENFVYGATIGVDWKKVKKTTDKILSKFKEGSQVHLLGENVDLKFKVHGKKAASDLDFDNFPAGEVFMAPFRESLNGKIKFDYPAIKSGKEVADIELVFKDGKVTSAKASKNEDFLKEMLATDENSSHVGEFGIGCNPKIDKFTKNLLFDEKIGGTIHLALGMAYKQNGGGNDSTIHWDIVKDMRLPGSVLTIDGVVVLKEGKLLV